MAGVHFHGVYLRHDSGIDEARHTEQPSAAPIGIGFLQPVAEGIERTSGTLGLAGSGRLLNVGVLWFWRCRARLGGPPALCWWVSQCLEANYGDESMKVPENLVKAVERLRPQAILLLDANTIMDYPQFVSHEIAAPGPFLLVVPQAVDNEILGLTFNPDPGTKQKASRALKQLGKLYERGNAEDGIGVGNNRWAITAKAPRPEPEGTRLEDDQIGRYLGQLDAALLRLADACAQDLPDTRIVLVTKDNKLTHTARSRGLAVCSWPKLRSPETVDKLLLPDDRSGPVPDIDTYFFSLLDPDEERPVRVTMTLEELREERRSEGVFLVAKGHGHLTYDCKKYQLDWTYPYESAERVTESLLEMFDNLSAMPLENVAFSDCSDDLQDDVKRLVCLMLEEAGWYDIFDLTDAAVWLDDDMEGEYSRGTLEADDSGWKTLWHRGLYSLQSPLVRVCIAALYMEYHLWGYSQLVYPDARDDLLLDRNSEEQETTKVLFDLYRHTIYRVIDSVLPVDPPKDDLDRVDKARQTYDKARRAYQERREKGNLIAALKGRLALDSALWQASTGYAFLIGDSYLNAHYAYKALAENLGFPVSSVETGMAWLLDVASDSWNVGETREREFTFRPFA